MLAAAAQWSGRVRFKRHRICHPGIIAPHRVRVAALGSVSKIHRCLEQKVMTTKIFAGTIKFYAMRRMREAIERAIHAKTTDEKGRAARWAAAWGTAASIPPVVQQVSRPRRIQSAKTCSPVPVGMEAALGQLAQ